MKLQDLMHVLKGMDVVNKQDIVDRFNVHERMVRNALSLLSKEGIIFINTKKNTYKRFTEEDYKEAEVYARTIQKSIVTQYHRRLKGLSKIIKDVKLRKELQQMQFAIEGKNNDDETV